MKKELILTFLSAFLLFSCSNNGETISSRPVDTGEGRFSDQAGFTYSYREDEQGYYVEDYNGQDKDVYIPDTFEHDGEIKPVVGIDHHAFSLRQGFDTVTLGKNIRYIGESAFAYSNVSYLYVTGRLTEIAEGAFLDSKINYYEYEDIKYLPSRSTQLCVAFDSNYGDGSYGQIYLPEGCEMILDNVLRNFNGRINYPSTIHGVGDGNLGIESTTRLEGVSSLTCYKAGKYAFHQIDNLISIVIEEGVKEIGEGAFFGCHNVASVKLPSSLEVIKNDAFEGFYALTDIIIPDNVKRIESNAFYGCSALTHARLPASLSFLGSAAFAHCEALQIIAIPGKDVIFEEGIFYQAWMFVIYCESTSLTSKIADGGIEAAYVVGGISGIRDVYEIDGLFYSECINNGKKESYLLGASSDGTEYAVKDLINGFPVTRIIKKAFSPNHAITKVMLPNTIETIEEEAFINTESLEMLNIPSSVTSIGSNAFSGCKNATLYCEASPKPDGFAEGWDNDVKEVIWGASNPF